MKWVKSILVFIVVVFFSLLPSRFGSIFALPLMAVVLFLTGLEIKEGIEKGKAKQLRIQYVFITVFLCLIWAKMQFNYLAPRWCWIVSGVALIVYNFNVPEVRTREEE